MKGLSVLVVDDEPLARRRLLRLLGKLDWVGPIAQAGDVVEAVQQISALQPDVLLLDIQMPGGSGFDVLAQLEAAPAALVFVTAFDHHALRAFEANAIDYLTKPIDPGRFRLAMERARSAIGARQQTDRIAELQETIAALRRALKPQAAHIGGIWVKSRDGGHVRIQVDDITWLQAERDYVRIHSAGGQHLQHDTLTHLERHLDPAHFIRIHRGSIVRLDAIVGIKNASFSSMVVVLRDGAEVRVGRTYTSSVRQRVMQGCTSLREQSHEGTRAT